MLMGGNGGNSAYVLAGLGAATALGSAVGQDPLGDLLAKWLQNRHVDMQALRRSPTHATSTSTIVMSHAASQVVYHHLGASADLRPEHIPAAMLAQAGALLLASFSILPEMRPAGFAAALAAVHNRGGLTALDIGPAIGRPATLAELRPLAAHLDYLIANTHELAVLTGLEAWEHAAQTVIDAGVKQVVIKRGREGASIRGRQVKIDVPGFGVQANISVGAGDSFNAGFVYGLRQGRPAEQALRFGNAVAALVVSGERGVLGAPALAQVEQFLQAQP
jgi:sugar/nucleoside kinase (ribokinase family)